MNIHTSRILALVMAFVMVLSMASVPAKAASAEIKYVDGDSAIVGALTVGDEVIALTAAMLAGGETAMEGGIYLSEQAIALAAVPFLGQVLGVDLTKVEENLPKSVFAPDSGSSLSLDQETFDALASGTAVQIPAVQVDEETAEKLGESAMKYVGMIVEGVSDAMKMSADSDVLDLGSREVDASIITLTVGPDDLAEICKSVLTEAAADEDMKALAAFVADSFMAGYSAVPGAPAPEGMEEMTGADLVASIWPALPELAEQVASSVAEAGLQVSISIAMDNETGDIACVGASVAAAGSVITLSATILPELVYVDLSADEVSLASFCFVTSENTDAAYEAALSIAINGQDMFIASYYWDKESGGYALVVTDETDTETTVLGTLAQNEDSIVLTVNQIDEDVMDLTITLSENGTAEMPEFQDVLTMSEEELTPIIEMVTSIASSVMGE